MFIKNTNGYMIFQFESIQEFEFLFKRLPIPNLVALKDKPLTFIPQAQAEVPFLIAGRALNAVCVPTVSNADVIAGFKENELTYCIDVDGIVPVASVIQKVNIIKKYLSQNKHNLSKIVEINSKYVIILLQQLTEI